MEGAARWGRSDVAEAGGRPLVSIVIPTFDSARWLASAIESALSQTHRNVEVIVVDDGSRDATPAVLERYGPSIRIETFITPRGPSAARNRGLELARGEFVQFLDADDLLLPTKVEECLAAFDSGVDMVFAENTYFLEEPGSVQGFSRLKQQAVRLMKRSPMSWAPDRAAEYMLRREVQTAMPLHRTSSLRRVGGCDEELWSLEDTELHFRLAANGSGIRKLDRVLVRCRHHGSPTRLRLRPRRFVVAFRAVERIEATAKRQGILVGYLRDALADRYAKVARKLLWEGHPVEAECAYQKAFSLSRWPRSTSVPIYNLLSAIFGYKRLEVARIWLARRIGRRSSVKSSAG
jgi:glycosyltransferase involved in cell wall biosynthesis